VAYSVITHLIDEQIFEYFVEAKRVLKSSGIAIFSFLDLLNPPQTEAFFEHAAVYHQGHGDLLKFMTKDVLSLFAKRVGMSDVEFLDNAQRVPTSGKRTKAMEGYKDYPAVIVEQSLCVMRS
jgi:hypothetical protein